MARVNIGREGDTVLLHIGGKTHVLPWEAALHISRALYEKAKLAEEHAKANDIIMDQAMATRLDLPFGFSNNRVIQREAMKEAQWNSELRKNIPEPSGIRTRERMGTPDVVRGDPKKYK